MLGTSGPLGACQSTSAAERKVGSAWRSVRFPPNPDVSWAILLLNQAHASQPGFGLLKLRNINFDQVKPTPAEHFGRSGIAGRKDHTTADAETVGGSWLALMNGYGVDRHELGGIDASRMIKQDWNASSIEAGNLAPVFKCRQPASGPNNIEANSSGDCARSLMPPSSVRLDSPT